MGYTLSDTDHEDQGGEMTQQDQPQGSANLVTPAFSQTTTAADAAPLAATTSDRQRVGSVLDGLRHHAGGD